MAGVLIHSGKDQVDIMLSFCHILFLSSLTTVCSLFSQRLLFYYVAFMSDLCGIR